MYRAMPGWAIDLMREGVPTNDLKERGGKAVWSALLSTATSAQQSSWDKFEWEHQIRQAKSILGRQLRMRDGRRELTPKAFDKQLDQAWEKAWEYRTARPAPWTAEEVREHAHTRAMAVLELVADAEATLTDSERAVLAFASQEHDRRGMLQVAMPRAAVVKATGMGERAVRTALTRLEERGLLILPTPGRSSAQPGKRRASLYGLPSEDAMGSALDKCRETRPMGPPALTYGTPGNSTLGTPALTYGTPAGPDDQPTNQKEQIMITLTCNPDGRRVLQVPPEHLTEVLAMLQGGAAVELEAQDLPANVTPLRAAGGQA